MGANKKVPFFSGGTFLCPARSEQHIGLSQVGIIHLFNGRFLRREGNTTGSSIFSSFLEAGMKGGRSPSWRNGVAKHDEGKLTNGCRTVLGFDCLVFFYSQPSEREVSKIGTLFLADLLFCLA